MPPPPPDSTANTPLAPSVEKAYYRKCIELKRRLNEVENANDEAKVRRVRLERGIMKMRLERAFLLDELRKRMDYNVDDSDSGEETMATPPVDRPHRDKRRRHNPVQQSMPPQSNAALPRQPSDPQHMKREFAAPETILPSQPPPSRGQSYMPPPPEYGAPPPLPSQQPPTSGLYGQPQSSPYGAQATPRPTSSGPRRGVSMSHGDEMSGAESRQARAAGEALSAGPAVRDGADGERRVASSEDAGGREGEGGFTAMNSNA